MDRSKKLSETEYEIMEVLWNSEAPMSASQISTLWWLPDVGGRPRGAETMARRAIVRGG